ELGGSAKDIWVGDDPDMVLASMREEAGDPHTRLRRIEPAEVRSLLDAALADAEAVADRNAISDNPFDLVEGGAAGEDENEVEDEVADEDEDSHVRTWAFARARA